MSVLITGGRGQLGADLGRPYPDAWAPGREELDITDDAALGSAFAERQPELVLNCAAFHHLDTCERDIATSCAVNVEAVVRLSRRCAESGARLVHMSTNYVFDGEGEQPYVEDDLPAPGSVYALTKLAGEHAALAYSDALVIRTAGLYGTAGSASKGGNFVERMLARARTGEPVRMVRDQRLSPTYTADLAQGLAEAERTGLSGLLHLTNGGTCSWLEFTEAIFELASVDVEVEGVGTSPGGVSRPLNGVLAVDRAAETGVSLPHWRDALGRYMVEAGLAVAQ